jgi:hypothetical protein
MGGYTGSRDTSSAKGEATCMNINRIATEADLDELAQMRWDFRLEGGQAR